MAAGFTPRGLNHWSATVFNDKARPDAKCFHSTTSQNPFNPPEFAETIRRQYTKAFAQQELEGRFVSLSGAIMKREWFSIIEQVPPLSMIVRYWDMAATPVADGKDPDWTAGAKVGRCKDGRWIILDIRHDRLSPRGNEMLIAQTALTDGRYIRIRMEEEGGASGKSLIEHYARTILGGYNFKGDRPTGDKITRALPFAAAAEAGNVMLLAGAWNKAFLDEVEEFSEDAVHDDQVDACSGAFNSITGRRLITPHAGSAAREGETSSMPDFSDILSKASSPEEKAELEEILKKELVTV